MDIQNTLGLNPEFNPLSPRAIIPERNYLLDFSLYERHLVNTTEESIASIDRLIEYNNYLKRKGKDD